MQPTFRPFVRHFDVFADYERLTDLQVVPLKGPAPVDKMRHAYASVPQRTGLKRRWFPAGFKPLERAERRRITYEPYVEPDPPGPHEPDPQDIIVIADSLEDSDVAVLPNPEVLSARKRKREEAVRKEERRSEKKARKAKKKAKKAKKKALKKEKKAAKKARKEGENEKTKNVDM
jgi:hypothetical protein